MQWTRFDDRLPPVNTLVLVRHWRDRPIEEMRFSESELAPSGLLSRAWGPSEWVLAPVPASPQPCGAFLKWVRNEAGKVSFKWDNGLTVWFDSGDGLAGYPITPEQASSAVTLIDAIDDALSKFRRGP